MKSTRFLATTVGALAIVAASLAPWETPVNHGSNPHVTNSYETAVLAILAQFPAAPDFLPDWRH